LEEKREKHRRRDMEQRLESAEVELAHLRRAVDDLSDVVARQSREIDQLARRVGMLLEREAEREAAGGGSIPLADQRPPHW
jgi:SlyX protein